MASYDLVVKQVRKETADTLSVVLEKPVGFAYKPGQYFTVDVGNTNDEKGGSRPLSIASSPTEDFLMFSTKISESEFKKRVAALQPGDKIGVMGPSGRFVLHDDVKIPAVLLGGGIGITPFRDMIKYVIDKKTGHNVVLLYSNKTPKDIVYRKEFDEWALRNKNFILVNTITRPEESEEKWGGRTGRVDASLIKEYSKENTIYYICGPLAMIDALKQVLKEMAVPDDRIRIEVFTGY